MPETSTKSVLIRRYVLSGQVSFLNSSTDDPGFRRFPGRTPARSQLYNGGNILRDAAQDDMHPRAIIRSIAKQFYLVRFAQTRNSTA
jgi:hypothetical protein